MKKVACFAICLLTLSLGAVKAQSKFEQDRKAILSLAGFYEVSFDYTETFAPDTAYKFHPKYHAKGYEMAVVEQDAPGKIVIQHILLTGDSSVIKHWREDWIYENTQLLTYQKDNTWKNVRQSVAEVKGKWTQKVFQVDDSPRYESTGMWTHVDGRDQWQSECDSPLPRREFTKRNDYNILLRGNRIYLTPTGWMFEQDNRKIIRTDNDKLLAREKGYEEFKRADPSKFAFAQNWWQQQQPYWKAVRQVWDEAYAQQTVIKLKGKTNGKLLYERLFEMAEQSVKEHWDAARSRDETRKAIADYLEKSV